MDENTILTNFKNYICSYYPITDAAFNLVAEISHVELVDKNQILLSIGEVSNYIYYVFKGVLIAYFSDTNGNTYNKNIFLENQLAASTVSSLLRKPSEFTIQSLQESVLLKIDFLKYKTLIDTNEELKNFYIAYLEKNWVIDKEPREISIVMQDAMTRYQCLIEKHPNIHKNVPLHHIASNLGITPTQLSRIRKKLQSI